jgi:arabinofuranosyltransferase
MVWSRAEKIALLIVACIAAGLLFAGWRLFWFLTDDAFISYRYVSNSVLGHGYVWNPPPFQPVEGYTNFLWVVLLDFVWRLLGVVPPESANNIALVFSAGTLMIAAAFTLRIPWHRDLAGFRIPCVALVLLGTVGNRSFLAWTSSGLETALFNFLVLGWLYFVLTRPFDARWVFVTTSSSTLLALTRPDGVLFVAASLISIAIGLRRRPGRDRLHLLWMALPAVLVPVHWIWRKTFYGDWLPNTYHAKVTGVWPSSGIRYAGSFILEYTLWIWILLAVFALVWRFSFLRQAFLCEPKGRFVRTAPDAAEAPRSVWHHGAIVRCIGLLTVVAHLGYYTFVVGGDHFEYRVYSYLVPLIFISFAWLMNAAQLCTRSAATLLACFVLFSFPLPWTHWHLSQERTTRRDTVEMFVPIAPSFPPGLSAYARLFDSLQAWLIQHFVCMRHQEHKIAYEWWSQTVIPTREVGQDLQIPDGEIPILVLPGGAGSTAWVLPQINIIDLHGLNDRVIGRSPRDPDQLRRMAHARVAPPGYIEAFAANVRILPDKKILVERRERAITADDIREIERSWMEKTKRAEESGIRLPSEKRS